MANYADDFNFCRMAKFTLLHEGPMSNAKFDPGGLTKYGFAQNMHPELDVKNLTQVQALQKYYTDYYLASCADVPYYALGFAIFECAVNQGVGRSIKLWQRAVGVLSDGKIGPVSRAALKACTPDSEVLALFMAYRVQAYVEIKDSNPNNYNTNNKGWFKRLFLCSAEGAKNVE